MSQTAQGQLSSADASPPAHPDFVIDVRARVRAQLRAFLSQRESEISATTDCADELCALAHDSVSSGKQLRSTFAYLGWLTRGDDSDAAIRAAASPEMLRSFALIQDDVMRQELAIGQLRRSGRDG